MSVKQHRLAQEIARQAAEMTDPAGRRVRVLAESRALALAESRGITLGAVYREALDQEIIPWRYLRNRDSITCQEQKTLGRSTVAVIGAGGLGGQVILTLARLGVGRLIVSDHDAFDESNLNRQALSHIHAVGRAKVREAAAAVARINPAVRVSAVHGRLEEQNAGQVLAGAAVVADALDNIPDRLMLQRQAQRLGIPLVHAALAGFEGQLMTIFPGDPGLDLIYGSPRGAGPAPAAVLGVPAPAPALLGTLQAMEVIKILLGKGKLLRGRMLHVDLETSSFEVFLLQEPEDN